MSAALKRRLAKVIFYLFLTRSVIALVNCCTDTRLVVYTHPVAQLNKLCLSALLIMKLCTKN